MTLFNRILTSVSFLPLPSESKRNFKNKHFAYFLTVLFLASCSTPRENQMISQAVLNQPSTVVVAQLSGFERPLYVPLGDQGLLGVMINEALGADLQEALNHLSLQPVVEEHFYKPFSEEFSSRKFDLQRYPLIIDRQGLSSPSEDKPEDAPYHFKFLQNKNKAKYALILDPSHCGLYRKYHSVIPVGSPRAWAGVKVYLVNLQDNRILGYHYSQADISISGHWDEGPQFDNALKAVKQALIQAFNEAHIYFFGWNPMDLDQEKSTSYK